MPKLLAYNIGPVANVCVVANGSIVSGSGDKTLRVWSNPYAASRVFRKEEEWRGLCVLPDGGIAVGNGKYVWVYSDPDPMRGGRARAAAVLSASSEESRARQRAAEERRYQEQRRQANEKAYRDARARENADRAAAARAAAAAIAPIRVLEGHTANVTSLCVLMDGRIVSGSEDNTLIVWTQGATCAEGSCLARWTRRAQTARNRFLGASLKILRGHTGAVTSVCAVPGDRIVSGSVDTTVRLWSADTGACLKVFTGHTGPVRSVCVLTDQWIVSGSDDTTVRVWDENSSTTRNIFKEHTGGVTCVAALPDNIFVSGSDDSTLRVWDFNNATCLRIMDGGRDLFVCLSVLADGRIISGSDHGLKIWETDEGETRANRARRAEEARQAVIRAEQARAEEARQAVIRAEQARVEARQAFILAEQATRAARERDDARRAAVRDARTVALRATGTIRRARALALTQERTAAIVARGDAAAAHAATSYLAHAEEAAARDARDDAVWATHYPLLAQAIAQAVAQAAIDGSLPVIPPPIDDGLYPLPVGQAVPQAPTNLSISQAPHIGTRVEGVGVFASEAVNVVNQEGFNDGDELVRIPAPGGVKMPPDVGGYHLFHTNVNGGERVTIQQWFDQGKRTNPNNRQVIQQNQLERFTYRKPAPAGGKRQSTKNKKSNRRRTVRR